MCRLVRPKGKAFAASRRPASCSRRPVKVEGSGLGVARFRGLELPDFRDLFRV